MSPVLLKGIIALGGVGAAGGGYWVINEFIRPRTLQQGLEREGYEFHDLEGDRDLEDWKSLAVGYQKNTENGNKFSGLSVGSTPGDEDARKLRDECRKLALKEWGGSDKDSDMQKLKSWCVKVKNPEISPSNSSPK